MSKAEGSGEETRRSVEIGAGDLTNAQIISNALIILLLVAAISVFILKPLISNTAWTTFFLLAIHGMFIANCFK